MFEDDFYKHVDKVHSQRRAEFEKLAAEPCLTDAHVGDRVLISGGVVGRGFEWIRLEAVVLEVADTAYQVEFKEPRYDGEPDIDWVHKFAVTDVLGPKQT